MSARTAPLREHDHKPQPIASSHLADRDGHTWRISTTGYQVRQCAIALPCQCQRAAAPPARQAQPAAKLATMPRRKAKQ